MNFKDFIDNSLQELHQLRHLKEEQQQGYDILYLFWIILAKGRWGYPFTNYIGSLGAAYTWGGAGGLKLVPGMPQVMLDLFDYNGDGLIGTNDQALIREIAELAEEIYNETGEFPPVMTAADYLQNWAYYSVLYGKDFPDPNGYAGQPGSNPDSPNLPNPNGLRADTIFGWIAGHTFWRSLTTSYDLEYFVEIYGQEVVDQILAVWDLDGDGQITGYPFSGYGGNGGDGEVWQMLYVLAVKIGLDIYEEQMPSPSELKDMFNNFNMLGDKTLADLYYERYGEYPGGNYQYYDPTYGQNQAPPPPEEVPQAQAPRPEIGPIG